MSIVLKNNASDFLASSIDSSQTTLTLQSAVSFPTIGGAQYFYVTLQDTAGQIEIVKVTARVGNTFTVVRGQNGTSAVSFAAGSRVELRINVESVEGGTYTPSGTSATALTIQNKLRESVSVKDFGAVADGLTNNTTAYANAIAYLAGIGGGTLYFPSGDYAGSMVINTSNVTILCANNVTLRAAGSSSVIEIGSDVENTQIINPKITGQTNANQSVLPPTNNTTALHCIFVRGKNTLIQNVIAYGARQDALYVRVIGVADLNVENCRFLGSARNTVSVVDGSYISFTNCYIESNRLYQSAFGNSLYLFDAEPGASDTYNNLSFINCRFVSNSSVSGAGLVILSDPQVADKNINTRFFGCSFENGPDSGANDAGIRPRFDSKGIAVQNCQFPARVLYQTGVASHTISDSLFENIVLGSTSFTFATALSSGCSLINVRSTNVSGLLAISGGDNAGVELINVQNFDNKTATTLDVSNGDLNVLAGDLSVVGSANETTKTQFGVASPNGGSTVLVNKRLSIAAGTSGATILTITAVAADRTAQVWDVTVNSQAIGSDQSKAQRSAKLAFMITTADGDVPVVNIISGYGWADTISSNPTGGDRNPTALNLAVTVDGNNDVIVTMDVDNTVNSSSNNIVLFAIGMGRRVSKSSVS